MKTFEDFIEAFKKLTAEHGYEGKFEKVGDGNSYEIRVIFPEAITVRGHKTPYLRCGLLNKTTAVFSDERFNQMFDSLKRQFMLYLPQMKAGIIDKKL